LKSVKKLTKIFTVIVMARRSLRASEEGINKARKAYSNQGWTQEGLAETADLKTRSAIGSFFARKPINRNNFIEICTALDLNWEEIVQQDQDTVESNADLNMLVHDVREGIRSLIKE
jgi:predicted NACHT family NTPase